MLNVTAYVLVNRTGDLTRFISGVECGDGCWSTSNDLRNAMLFDSKRVKRVQSFIDVESGRFEGRFLPEQVQVSLPAPK